MAANYENLYDALAKKLIIENDCKVTPLIVQTLICAKTKFMDTQRMHPDTLV
jgi:hypothetical protein